MDPSTAERALRYGRGGGREMGMQSRFQMTLKHELHRGVAVQRQQSQPRGRDVRPCLGRSRAYR
jgi:hypothetical protein